MLIDVHKYFDSLRELESCMKAQSMKLFHLRPDYVVRSNTLTKANQRQPQEFFVKIYASLLERYTPFLADSNTSLHSSIDSPTKCDYENSLPTQYELNSSTILTRFYV